MDPYGHLERGTGGGISWLFRPRLFTRAVQYYNRICSKFARRTEHTISNWRRTVFSTSVLVSSSYAKWRPRQFRMISLHGSKAELLGNDMVMKKKAPLKQRFNDTIFFGAWRGLSHARQP